MEHLSYDHDALTLDGAPLDRLAEEFGTPLYVYCERTIQERFRALDGAFAGVPHRILYSVKANSTRGVLSVLARLGAGADVVSGGELARALAAGLPASQIVFAGTGKTDSELAQALEAGIFLINVESPGELSRLRNLARRLQRPARVALRITPEVTGGTHDYIETGTRTTKFGLPLEEALDIGRRLRSDEWVRIVGLHAHFGSQILSVGPFVETAQRLRRAVFSLREAGVQVSVINIGGGIGIRYLDEEPFAAHDLAEALRPVLADLDVEVLLEPGRYLVGSAGLLLSRVIDLKSTGERTFCVVDAAMNDLIRPALYGAHHEALPARRKNRPIVEMDLVGPICESGDFLAKSRRLPALEPGDLVAFENTGAYGFSMSSNYNSRPRAAEVMVCGGRSRLIRERESLEDLTRGEIG